MTVTIDSLTRSSSFSFDDHHRPVAVTYHGGEVVTTEYGSPGAAVGLSSSIHGDLVDEVNYDEAGRMTALRFPAGGNLWRTQRYYPWTAQRNGGMLASLKVGYDEGTDERLSRGYAYNGFGDVTALTEGADSYTFSYDGLGRLTSAYGRSYSYDKASRLTAFNGQSYGYGDSGPFHAVDRIAGTDRFDYDGNMTVRNKGLSDQQTLVWDAENRLSQVQDDQGNLLERYWYGAGGVRVKKTSGNTTTYSFFAHYEEEVTNGVTTAISYYAFGGLRIAVKRGNSLYHLHGDHLGSTSLTTRGSAETASRAYYAYGAERSATGDLQTDHTFTGQKRDATGLMYYNARYYDPARGTFVSPDSMVPGAGQVINYNRFLYPRGNPLKYSDPSGYASDPGDVNTGECSTQECWERKWYWNNRWYRAHGYGFSKFTNHWATNLLGGADFADKEILNDVLAEAGISAVGNWVFVYLKLLGKAVVDLGRKIGPGAESGLERLKELTGGGVHFRRADISGKPGTLGCDYNPTIRGCAFGKEIEFYDRLYSTVHEPTARGVVVHELAHVIANNHCTPVLIVFCVKVSSRHLPGWDLTGMNPDGKTRGRAVRHLTNYAGTSQGEYWAEAVSIWVYESRYKRSEDPGRLNRMEIDFINWVLRP